MHRIAHILLSRSFLIPLFCIGFGILCGLIALIVYQKIGFHISTDKGGSSVSRVVSYNGIDIVSDLSSSEAQGIVNFLDSTLKKELLPSHLELASVANGSLRQESPYGGSWRIGKDEFSLLYVRDTRGGAKYFRVWMLKQEQKVDMTSSFDLIRTISSNSVWEGISPLHCADTVEGVSKGSPAVTVCEHMIAGSGGDKIGALVRSPLVTDHGERWTIVSACLVPKESSGYSEINFCI